MSKSSTTKVPITNDDPKRNLHIAGLVIRPGETRHVPAHYTAQVAPESGGSAAVPNTTNPLQQLAGENAATVIATLTTLSDAQLIDLAKAENDKAKPRVTVVEAITAEQLARAKALEANNVNTGQPLNQGPAQ